MAYDLVEKVEEQLDKVATLVRDFIDDITTLEHKEYSLDLLDPMRYSALAEGKMTRAYLVYSFSKILNVSYVSFLRVAAAIELIHCYSLVHDDLPAMDNDDMRRGKKSCHKEYDEASAVLAGDALQSLAFEVLANYMISNNPHNVIKLISEMAKAIGYNGMAGGQYLDISGEDDTIDKIIHLQKLKTGRLIEYSCNAPVILANPKPNVKRAIAGFAHDIGLAYQIQDDLLDARGDSKKTGKKTKKDQAMGKKNLVNFLGEDKAQQQAELLIEQAKGHLDIFGHRAEDLMLFSDYLLCRDK